MKTKKVKKAQVQKQEENGSGCTVCGEPYDYEGTGLCGPCATGEAETIGDGEYTGS